MSGWARAPGKGDHDFHIRKLVPKSIFFLDLYGGSAPMTPDKYYLYAAKP